MTTPPIILITGPTATGKTALSIALAKELNAEIISADSQLVYKELNIGTAKPSTEEQAGIPHYGIDVVEPTVQYTAGNYADDISPVLQKLISENKPVIITGGTGFYIQALLQPDRLQKIPPNPEFRKTLEALASEKSEQWLYEQLQEKDPKRATQLHPKDTRRVIRALEIIEALGHAVPETPTDFIYPVHTIGLTYESKDTYQAMLNKRLDKMLSDGFMDEAVSVFNRYGQCPALETAYGYTELIDVYQGKCDLEIAKKAIQIMHRQYSKRQMTWFRKVPDIKWYAVDIVSKAEIVESILSEVAK